MSHPRYDWWSYTKGMIRRYPALKAEFDGQETADTIWTLRCTRRREYEAVRRALAETALEPNGCWKLELVRLVFWERSRTLDGVAMRVHIGSATAKRWHAAFIYRVAENYGLMEG